MSELSVLTSPLLEVPGIRHGFFTRLGGVSEGIYDSLNVGIGSRDDPGRVLQNRRRAAACFGLVPNALVTGYQIHSARALVVAEPWSDRASEGDAIVTATPGVMCGALSADCAPVLIADPESRVVAAVHAGWQGALAGVVESAIDRMVELGAAPRRMVAAVGPCIGPSSYEVGPEFRERFLAAHAANGRFFVPSGDGGKAMFDLPAFVLDRLCTAGIEACAWIGRDTCAEEDLFFSNRRAFKRGETDYGRLLSAIALA